MVFGGVMVCIKLAGERLRVLDPALKDNWGDPESGLRKSRFRLNPGIGLPKMKFDKFKGYKRKNHLYYYNQNKINKK